MRWCQRARKRACRWGERRWGRRSGKIGQVSARVGRTWWSCKSRKYKTRRRKRWGWRRLCQLDPSARVSTEPLTLKKPLRVPTTMKEISLSPLTTHLAISPIASNDIDSSLSSSKLACPSTKPSLPSFSSWN